MSPDYSPMESGTPTRWKVFISSASITSATSPASTSMELWPAADMMLLNETKGARAFSSSSLRKETISAAAFWSLVMRSASLLAA